MGIHSSKGLESNVGQRMTPCQWASPGGVGMSMVMCVALLTTIYHRPIPEVGLQLCVLFPRCSPREEGAAG